MESLAKALWRVTRKTHAEQPLTGEGARRFGGRWNHVGTPVVYTSGTLSLAVLEYLVNLPISDLPDDLVSIELRVPNDLPRTEIATDELPNNWRTFPAIEELKNLGTEWVREGKTPILTVPSVVIPNELNYLVNPAHEGAKQIEVASVEAFALDVRLYRARRPTRKASRKSSG
jgi:RES domain-containing protein